MEAEGRHTGALGAEPSGKCNHLLGPDRFFCFLARPGSRSACPWPNQGYWPWSLQTLDPMKGPDPSYSHVQVPSIPKFRDPGPFGLTNSTLGRLVPINFGTGPFGAHGGQRPTLCRPQDGV